MRILLPAIFAFASVSYVPVAHASVEDGAKSEGKLICKHRKKTGTRFTTKTCKTAAQWDRISEDSRAAANEMINRPIISTERGN
jgi:hypothetical protein